jgi:hypothetical protein
MQPSPAFASGEAETSTPDLPRSKRVRKEGTGGDSGRAEEDRPSPRLESAASGAGAEEPIRPEVAAGAVSSPAAATGADPMPAWEVTPAEAATPPPPAAEDAAARNDAAAPASSDPPSQQGTREATAETTVETPEPAGRTPSSPRLAPSVQAVMPAFGTGVGAAAGPLLFGLASNSGEASQGPLATRVARSERGETSPAPEVATKDASGGKALATAAGSGIGSLSSASQLQQEWADTASSVDAGDKLKVQGSKPTLAELSK